MPLYDYKYLEVTCFKRREFRPNQMRQAVEYLRTQPQGRFVGLSAYVSVKLPQYDHWLRAAPLIHLDSIIGKTPKQVWDMFDAEVTAQIKDYVDGRESAQ